MLRFFFLSVLLTVPQPYVFIDHADSTLTLAPVTIIDRVCLIAADVVIVLVTIYHTYGTIKASRQVNLRPTFSSTLLNAGMSVPLQGVQFLTRFNTIFAIRCPLFRVCPSICIAMLCIENSGLAESC